MGTPSIRLGSLGSVRSRPAAAVRFWQWLVVSCRSALHEAEELGSRILAFLDRPAGRAFGVGSVTLGAAGRVRDWLGHLRFEDLVSGAETVGGRALEVLQRVGARSQVRARSHAVAQRPVNRLPRGSVIVIGAVTVFAVLLGWMAMQNLGGGDDWYSTPGANNAEVANSSPSANSSPGGATAGTVQMPMAPASGTGAMGAMP